MPEWLDVRRLLERVRERFSGALPVDDVARRARRLRVGLIAFGVLLLGTLGAAVCAGPWVERRAIAEAAKRGVELSIEDVDVGLSSVTLRGVSARGSGS